MISVLSLSKDLPPRTKHCSVCKCEPSQHRYLSDHSAYTVKYLVIRNSQTHGWMNQTTNDRTKSNKRLEGLLLRDHLIL